jgi:hypothetical protein
MGPNYGAADVAAARPIYATRRVVRDIWVSREPNQSTQLASARLRLRRRTRDSRVIRDRPDGDQFATSVVIRLGTSPTGTTALTVLLSVSMAVTDLMAAFEM